MQELDSGVSKIDSRLKPARADPKMLNWCPGASSTGVSSTGEMVRGTRFDALANHWVRTVSLRFKIFRRCEQAPARSMRNHSSNSGRAHIYSCLAFVWSCKRVSLLRRDGDPPAGRVAVLHRLAFRSSRVHHDRGPGDPRSSRYSTLPSGWNCLAEVAGLAK